MITLLLTLALSATALDGAAADPSASTGVTQTAKPAKPKKVCEKIEITGSTVPKRVCRTVTETTPPPAPKKVEAAPIEAEKSVSGASN